MNQTATPVLPIKLLPPVKIGKNSSPTTLLAKHLLQAMPEIFTDKARAKISFSDSSDSSSGASSSDSDFEPEKMDTRPAKLPPTDVCASKHFTPILKIHRR
jgi:hypothetical protein